MWLPQDQIGNFALGDRDDIRRKPSADPVLLAMRELGCNKAIYVGDSEVDIETAKNANIPCISVTWGFRDRDELAASGASYFADNADELGAILLDLTNKGERID